jgi:hypothetical protein
MCSWDEHGNEWLEEESHYEMDVMNYSSFQVGMDAYGHEIDGSSERTVIVENPWSFQHGYFLTSSTGALERIGTSIGTDWHRNGFIYLGCAG